MGMLTSCQEESEVSSRNCFHDSASLLQKPGIALVSGTQEGRVAAGKPHVIVLRRETVPIYRRGKIVFFKTSYSGVLSVGLPPQDFRVVFDTGSGHVVLPATECYSEACTVPGRRRYNQTDSHSSIPINSDGSFVHEGELSEQVTIGFGTGEITGEFARDTVCFGATRTADEKEKGEAMATADKAHAENVEIESQKGALQSAEVDYSPICVEMNLIVAVDMSTQPFKTFQFDGILGLSLPGLAMNRNFSAFDMLVRSGLAAQPQFGVFLTEGEEGEDSEVAFGGVDPRRVLEPLTWSKVPMSDLGYWQVRIKAVRIDGEELDVCRDGTCRGVVDTGTSHLGIPAPFDKDFEKRLQTDAGDLLDCRHAKAPMIEIELFEEKVLTLYPFNYMRRLPLREGVTVGSAQGVVLEPTKEAETAKSTATPPDAAEAATQLNAAVANPDASIAANVTDAPLQAPASGDEASSAKAKEPLEAEAKRSEQGPHTQRQESPAAASIQASPLPETEQPIKRHCSPRLMAVRLPEPLGPKLFILGEPLLHRYYTVYDWENQQVGFALANNRWNRMDPKEIAEAKGILPSEVDMLLMQKTVKVTRPKPIDEPKV